MCVNWNAHTAPNGIAQADGTDPCLALVVEGRPEPEEGEY